jgi:hypothetical protein
MCQRCPAPSDRYIIQDKKTGLFVCEECGFSVKALTSAAYKSGSYIWDVNPAWPSFNSFEDLMIQVTGKGTISMPACNLVRNMPSRLLSYAYEVLMAEASAAEK